MTRTARHKILYNNCFAHIFSRSIETKYIFENPEDFEFFKTLLLETKKARPFKIHHYCLMHTHFHLAVSIPDVATFSQGLKLLKWKYTQYFNHIHKRRGPLWQARFKSLVIEDEAYLHACGLYIENNPVAINLAETASEWPYSSSAYYLENKPDPLIDPYERPDALPDEVNLNDASAFVKGDAIGSKLFRIYQQDAVPVP